MITDFDCQKALERELNHRGFKVSDTTIGRVLPPLGYTLHANRKRLTHKSNPDRDRQIQYLIRWRHQFLKAGNPVISVDTKKRELVGNFKNRGVTWRRSALSVLEYDYRSEAEGIAIPYGVYDVARQEGLILIGTSHQTPEFAVAAIRWWWCSIGQQVYANCHRLLIEADCGNPNSNSCLRWKYGLQQLADEFNLRITVTHLPTGASKWNPIEHRLFSFISLNWAGQPLVNYETILKFIRTTHTETGLRCKAYLDKTSYPIGWHLSLDQIESIRLIRHRIFPKWNYTIRPHSKIKKTVKLF